MEGKGAQDDGQTSSRAARARRLSIMKVRDAAGTESDCDAGSSSSGKGSGATLTARSSRSGERDLESMKSSSGVATTIPSALVPAPPPACPKGSENAGSVKKMLDDLQRSRMCIEQDQTTYRKARAEIANMDKKISELQSQTKKAEERWKGLAETAAIKRTELNSSDIKNKIASETIRRTESELARVLDDLHKIRIESSNMANTLLSESVQFATIWCGTAEGRNNRCQFQREEVARLDNQKRQMESELAGFLALQKEVKEYEMENEDLDRQYKKLDETMTKDEQELRGRISVLDMKLKDLKHQHDTRLRSSEEEIRRLKRQIQEKQGSLTKLQNQNMDAKNNVRQQKFTTKSILKSTERTACSTIQQRRNSRVEYNNYSDPAVEGKIKAKIQEIPIKPTRGILKSTTKRCIAASGSGERFSDSNDEDICVAAATAVSQNMRAYEPMTPSRTFSHRPPPAKLRAVENYVQVPITSFMRQLSSTLKRPKHKISTSTPCKPVRVSEPNLSASTRFSFKKKGTALSDNEDMSTNFDTFDTHLPGNAPHEMNCSVNNGKSDIVGSRMILESNEKPYGSFNSSRILLSESQANRL